LSRRKTFLSAVAQKLLTAEGFRNLPDLSDGSQQELVCGWSVTTPPKGQHGICYLKVGESLGTTPRDEEVPAGFECKVSKPLG